MADKPDILGDQIPEDVEAMFEDTPTPAEEQPEPTEQPEAEAPVEPETPSEEAPETAESSQAASEPEAPAETPAEAEATEVEPEWRKKYESPEKMWEAYRHQQASATRLAQERAEVQRRLQEYEEKLPQVAAYVDQLQRQVQAQVRQNPAQVPDDVDLTDPEVQAYINTQVQAQVQQSLQQAMGPLQQQQEQARQQAIEEARHQQAQQEFYAWQRDNPEVHPDSPMWTAMNNVLYELQYDPEVGQPIPDNFPTTPENLTIAKELASDGSVLDMARRLQFVPSDEADIQLLKDAAQTPALADHLEANPSYLESLKGHAIARQLAGMPQAVAQARSNGEQAQQQAAAAAKKAAYVESDSPGTPAQAAPGQRPEIAEELDDLGFDEWQRNSSILNR